MSGFSITVNGTPVALTGGTIVGNKVIFTAASEIYPNDTVLGSYDAGAGDIQGESSPLASFTSQPATNGSGAIPPGASYPLNDDGTLAAEFGLGWMQTNAPDYRTADYTYTGAQAGGTAVALPTAANAFASQAVTVGPGKILAMELVIYSAPAGDFDDLGLLALLSDAGVPYSSANVYIYRYLGQNFWDGNGLLNPIPMVSSLAGFHIGVEFNGNDGTVTYRSSDGSTATTQTFTPGTQVTMGMNAVDAGTTAAGQTASIRALLADEMTLPFTAGAVDFNGDVIA